MFLQVNIDIQFLENEVAIVVNTKEKRYMLFGNKKFAVLFLCLF
jgi:hypothetical protein